MVKLPTMRRHQDEESRVLDTPICVSVRHLGRQHLKFQKFFGLLVRGKVLLVEQTPEIQLKALIIKIQTQFTYQDDVKISARPMHDRELCQAFDIYTLQDVTDGTRPIRWADSSGLLGIFITKFRYALGLSVFVIVAKHIHGGYERIGHIRLGCRCFRSGCSMGRVLGSKA